MSILRLAGIRLTCLFILLSLITFGIAEAGVVSTSADMPVTSVQDKKEKKKKKKNRKAKLTGKAPVEIGTPAIWEEQADISLLDLFWGIGGPDLAPKPPFKFDQEDFSGTNPKIKIIDANGVKWNVKFDEEVQAEVAASRIVWACGYMVEESYFVTSGRVDGVHGLTRARDWIGPDGSFTRAMFEKRPDTITRRKTPWAWDSNPFTGARELSGLAILNTMLNNWDAKSDNNNVLAMFDEDGETVQEWYMVTDWGGTFGNMGGNLAFNKSKWDLDDFRKQKFIDGISRGSVKLHYRGKMSSSLKTVPLEHARWFAGLVGQLTDEQLRAAFKAAGATPAEEAGFAMRLREKINELVAAAGMPAGR
ncbi:MAG: hypothetical protein IPM66_12500 [Acidobacteriota bacterium]|nr:MAG: hypothetical protein IPM66_12500 [Acidobacteriota bacterium]